MLKAAWFVSVLALALVGQQESPRDLSHETIELSYNPSSQGHQAGQQCRNAEELSPMRHGGCADQGTVPLPGAVGSRDRSTRTLPVRCRYMGGRNCRRCGTARPLPPVSTISLILRRWASAMLPSVAPSFTCETAENRIGGWPHARCCATEIALPGPRPIASLPESPLPGRHG